MNMDTVIDPLAGLSSDTPAETTRSHAAQLVLGGAATLEQANVALAARGAAPLMTNSKEAAETARSALMNDDAFRAAYLAGSPEAVAKLFKLDLAVQQATEGKLTDRPPSATDRDYNTARNTVFHNIAPDVPADKAIAHAEEFTGLLASLQMPGPSATAFVAQHQAAVAETNPMTAEERTAWGEQQKAMLYGVIGPNAEEKLKAASETLGRMRGKTFDLSTIVRSNGAAATLTLYQTAEALAAKGKGR
jgi:hypothetical protein